LGFVCWCGWLTNEPKSGLSSIPAQILTMAKPQPLSVLEAGVIGLMPQAIDRSLMTRPKTQIQNSSVICPLSPGSAPQTMAE
jgi:hypothetical protein